MKVRKLENIWNTHNATHISSTAFASDCLCIFGSTLLKNQEELLHYLRTKVFTNEYLLFPKYQLRLFTFNDNKISLIRDYEYENKLNEWYRGFGNESLEFQEDGEQIKKMWLSYNEARIAPQDRVIYKSHKD